MPAPHYTCTYPGIQDILRASLTVSGGVAPAVATIVTIPEALNNPQSVGELVFGEASFGPIITIPDAVVLNAKVDWVAQGRNITIQIADRRYFWKFPRISGQYNSKHPDETVDPETEKTPQELATLLLEALGEDGFDVSEMPNDTRPSVNWDLDLAAPALQTLCDGLECVISFGNDGAVKVYKRADEELPPGPVMVAGNGANGAVAPANGVTVFSDRVQFQDRLFLEAAAVDTGQEVKQLDDVSYTLTDDQGQPKAFTPNAFWEVEVQHGKKQRQLAEESVYRLYRFAKYRDENGAELPFEVEGQEVEDIRRQVVILNQAAAPSDHGEVVRRSPARVYGKFIGQEYHRRNEYRLWTHGFSIDPGTQTVTLSQPAYQIDEDGEPFPAELYLECAYEVRDNDQNFYRLFLNSEGSDVDNSDMTIREDIIPNKVQEYDEEGNRTTVTNNSPDVYDRLQKVLDQLVARYEVLTGETRQYEGIRFIAPDGAVQQVTWSVSGGAAYTLASIGQTHERFIDPPSERNVKELINALQVENDRAKAKEAARGNS